MNKRRARGLLALGIFMMAFVFSFLALKSKNVLEANAANMAAFDAGNIISDFQMGNYNSMNEGQIQNFLKSKNPCNDTATWKSGNNVGHLSESTPYSWHVAGGHYVCMADENFNGESAAHIIWQAAQDYRINPQVLIVLLQKEQGLVTDTFPNSVQYRSAMGYGCPDTAACASKYYGFRNQVRNAAALFRSVLDGGWTNYPVGQNYVRYNPNAACGGTVVNIRNRATSALYRYTPYQPNAAALASSYGGGDGCSAYGNRNFYSYFEDWFGDGKELGYRGLDVPRNMRLKNTTSRINPYTEEIVDELENGMVRKYIDKIRLNSGDWCLRTEYSVNNEMDACVRFSDLEDYYEDFENPRYLRTTSSTNRINPYNGNIYDTLENGKILRYTTKIYTNGKWYYRTEHMTNNGIDAVVPAEVLEEVAYVSFENPRYLKSLDNADIVNPYNGLILSVLEKGKAQKYSSKIFVDGVWYYRTEDSTNGGIDEAVSSETLGELSKYLNFERPRSLVLAQEVKRINPYTLEVYDVLERGMVLEFTTKIFINDQWYYRTRYMSDSKMDVVIPASAVKEL